MRSTQGEAECFACALDGSAEGGDVRENIAAFAFW
jgi:hypothetical protein